MSAIAQMALAAAAQDVIREQRAEIARLRAVLSAFNAAYEEEDSTEYSNLINHANELMLVALGKAGAAP